jgi:hypothetical protein
VIDITSVQVSSSFNSTFCVGFEDDGEVPDESIDMRYEFSNVA